MGSKIISCIVCKALTTWAPWRVDHCGSCWEHAYPEQSYAKQSLDRLADELAEDEAMGKGEIHSRPPGDSIRKVHRPGTMKWDGKQWVLAKNKPSLS